MANKTTLTIKTRIAGGLDEPYPRRTAGLPPDVGQAGDLPMPGLADDQAEWIKQELRGIVEEEETEAAAKHRAPERRRRLD